MSETDTRTEPTPPGSAPTAEGARYATLVGDVAASRSYSDQKRLFTALRAHFEAVNALVPAVQPIRFSVGDEFQAAYASLADALRATVLLRLRFKSEALTAGDARDQDVRIGLAWGAIDVFDAEAAPFGQSGPAWWQARSAIEEAESRQAGHGLPYSIRSHFAAEEPVLTGVTNALLIALDQVVFRMDEKDVRVALGSLEGRTQKQIGESLGIGQPTVSRRYKHNGPATIVQILASLRGEGR